MGSGVRLPELQPTLLLAKLGDRGNIPTKFSLPPQFAHLENGSSKYLLHRVVVKIKKVHVYEAFRTVLRTLAICYCCMIVIILL